MTATLDLAEFARSLDGSGDDELMRVARLVRSVSSGRYRPRDATLHDADRLCATVRADFPTAFAGKFESFLAADRETSEAIVRFRAAVAAGAPRDVRSEAEYAVSRKFNSSFLELWGCWKQIVRYVPFVFLAALQRMDDGLLERHVGAELKRALNEYRRAYAVENRERRAEACQRDLLVSLLKVFRKLERDGLMAGDFILAPVMPAQRFSQLFPERFDAALIFLQQVRNRLVHADVGDRPPDVVEPLQGLCRWYLLEVVALLAPISRAFAFGYVDDLEVTGGSAVARVTAYVGIDGPVAARYCVSAAPQLDHYEFEAHRLYLIARGRGGAAETPLETRDYLDLTPFLIADRYAPAARLERDAASPSADRDVLALDRYGSLRQLLYLQLAGKGQAFIERLASSEPSARGQAATKDDLFDAVGRFVGRITQLTAMVTLQGAAAAQFDETRRRLWEISKPAAGAVFDVERFDFNGTFDRSVPPRDRRATYDPDLYVEPREAVSLAELFGGERRGLVLAGASGYGKSNVLAHAYLQRCRAGAPCVFLTGRMVRSARFCDALLAHVTGLMYSGWTLDDLAAFLETNGTTLSIFVDALNEYTGVGGALTLLQDAISTIQFDDRLARCRVVIALRTETWMQYRQNSGDRPLDTAVFVSAAGDALNLGSFDEETRRRTLFERYRAVFGLRPARYEELSASVAALVARPYFMAAIAETYSNRDLASNSSPRKIPRVLGYLQVFQALTERKAADTPFLLAAGDERRGSFSDDVLNFLAAFARVVYRQLSASGGAECGTAAAAEADAVLRDTVNKDPSLQAYVRASDRSLSVAQATLQAGLLIRTTVPRRNALGKFVDSAAYAFFHDQYTQFWLAQVFRSDVFADVGKEVLSDPNARLAVAARVVAIVRTSSNSPLLAGALGYWLENLQRDVGLAPVVTLVGDVATLENGIARLFAADVLTGWVLRGAVAPEALYREAFAVNNGQLCAELGAAFLTYWPDLGRRATKAFVATADAKRDAGAIEALAESFAGLFANESEQRRDCSSRVLDFLRGIVPGIEPRALLAARHAEKYLRFTLQFCAKTLLLLAFDEASMRALGEFARAKLRLLVGLIVALRGLRAPLSDPVRRPLWSVIESAGFTMWDNAIAQRGANDRFFTADEGVNQNHVLRRFMPYVCALHNRDFEPFDLSPGSEYRALVLEMLNYRPRSVIGYVAMVTLPFALGADWDRTRDFIDELIGSDRRGAIFFGSLLLVNLTYADATLREPALNYLVDALVPNVLARGLSPGDALLDGVGIAEQDPPKLWPILERGMLRAVDAVGRLGAPEPIERFGNDLFRVNFFPQTEIAKRTVALILARGFAERGSPWRVAALKILAGMRYRNPVLLRALLEGRPDADELMHATGSAVDPQTEAGARAFGYETSWNPLVQRALASNTTLRYLILKYLVGGLAGTNTVAQYTKSWRAFVVETIAAYFGPAQPAVVFATLTQRDWEGAVESRWSPDGGRA